MTDDLINALKKEQREDADTIEALRAENARLREALSGLMADYYAARRMSGYSDLDVHGFEAYRKARAAMGESDE